MISSSAKFINQLIESSPKKNWRLSQEDWDEETITREEVKRPSMYKVILHNDDYTTMEFVIEVLKKVFHLSATESEKVMLQVHHQGSGICGVYSFEIAETKVYQATEMAKNSGHPLLCTMEEE